MRRILPFLAMVLVTSCNGGGSGASDDGPAPSSDKADLQRIFLSYQGLVDNGGYAPSNINQIFRNISSDPKADFTQYTILWGVDVNKIADKANTVLAYQTTAPKSGGVVLLADGTVKKLTAEEFGKLSKATPSMPTSDQPVAAKLKFEEFFDKSKAKPPANYMYKVLEIEGLISDFSIWQHTNKTDKSVQLMLEGIELGKPDDDFTTILAKFETSVEFGKYMIGQRVTLRGLLTTASGTLCECKVVKAEPAEKLAVTIEKLVEDYKADSKSFSKKYKGKALVVTGTISKMGRQPQYHWKGSDNDLLAVALTDHYFRGGEPTIALREGDKIQALGKISYTTSYYPESGYIPFIFTYEVKKQ